MDCLELELAGDIFWGWSSGFFILSERLAPFTLFKILLFNWLFSSCGHILLKISI